MTDMLTRSSARVRARGTAVLVLPLAGALMLAGCTSSPSAAPTTGSATSTAAGSSASVSGSRDAWVRGTNVTLTNATGSAVEVKPYTYSAGEGSYASLATGASTSATSSWDSASATRVILYMKTSSGGVAAITLYNAAVGEPASYTCESASATGCAQEDVKRDFGDYHPYDEGETQTVSTTDGAATFTVTRDADDDDNKNWTVSLDSLS